MCMEKKVFIFGDSYADPKGTPNYVWHKRLIDIFSNTRNFAVSGTGPQHAFSLFYKEMTDFKKDDIIIFLLSNPFRIHWPAHALFQHSWELSAIQWNGETKETECVFRNYPENLKNSKHIKIINYYNEHKKEMDFFYKTYMKELEVSNEKNISFLYTISQALNLKLIVFDVFPRNFEIPIARTKLSQQLNNNINFHLCDQSLSTISHNEVYKEELHKYDNNLRQGDKRRNHLSPENHDIMFEYILSVIDNKCYFSPEFKQHFLYFDEVYQENVHVKNNPIQYIYE